MNNSKILQQLSEGSGVSGAEKELSTRVQELFNHYTEEVKIDALGNVIGYRPGEGRTEMKVMLAAHMDEIGLMVTEIEDGFLRFTTVGGIDQRTLVGQEVIIQGQQNTYQGIIGAKPPHIQEKKEQDKAYKLENMYIDVGLPPEEVEEKIQVGDIIIVQQQFKQLEKSRVTGKALDDRAGILLILNTLEELTKLKHEADIYSVATVQEEVGVRGAITSTYDILPDLGIAIDVCHATMPGVSKEEAVELGEGPAIGLGPHIHPQLFNKFRTIGEELNLSYQVDTSTTPRGTDAYAIQVTRSGIPTALISIPLRYMHTAVETADLNDIKQASRLLARTIAELNREFVEGLECF